MGTEAVVEEEQAREGSRQGGWDKADLRKSGECTRCHDFLPLLPCSGSALLFVSLWLANNSF